MRIRLKAIVFLFQRLITKTIFLGLKLSQIIEWLIDSIKAYIRGDWYALISNGINPKTYSEQ